jgi:uncharacterized protein (DUF1015 family)
MAFLTPFRALRPTPASAARVAAVPYDVVSTEEARALATDPLSFLHVSRAEIDLPPSVSPYSDGVYERARQNFDALRRKAPLVTEDEASLYIYRLTMGGHVQTGVAGGFGLDDYDAGVIKKHEHTRVDKENDRTRHMIELRAQTGPVFLTYRASSDVDHLAASVADAAPLFDFEAVDGVRHTVWRADAASAARLVSSFAAIPALYIADGHHRAASASRARASLKNGGLEGPAGSSEKDRVLAVAFPDREMQVLPYNRVVRDFGGTTDSDSFLSAVKRAATVRAGGPVPPGQGHVSMFLGREWHDVELPAAPVGASAAARLDVSRLHDAVLGPLLGIGDPRTDPRIEFSGGARGTAPLEERVRSGRAAAAFSMHPVRVEDLMTVSDAGDIMPPKSTWFEPKLRDGLLSHLI